MTNELRLSSNELPQSKISNYGISVARSVTDNEVVQQFGDILQSEFGDAVSLNDSEIEQARFVLLGRRRTAGPVLAAMAITGESKSDVFNRVARGIPPEVWGRRHINSDRFAVRPYRYSVESFGDIGISVGAKSRNLSDWSKITRVFDDISGVKSQWGYLSQIIRIATLRNPSAMRDIRKFRLDQRLTVPLGRLSLARKTSHSVQVYSH